MADDFRDLFKYRPGDEPAREGADSDAPDELAEINNRRPRGLNEKEVKVLGIWGAQDPNNPDGPPKQTFVLLRDNRGRRAPIFIGPFETLAIQMAYENAPPERPLTHDLLKISIERLGGTVERVTIDDLWQSTFYAKITVAQKNAESIDIDARPSDAIALALRTRSPIYMAEHVIEEIGQEESDD